MSVAWKFGDYVKARSPHGVLQAEGVAKSNTTGNLWGRPFDLRVGDLMFYSDEVFANLTEDRRVPVGVGPQHDGRPRGQ